MRNLLQDIFKNNNIGGNFTTSLLGIFSIFFSQLWLFNKYVITPITTQKIRCIGLCQISEELGLMSIAFISFLLSIIFIIGFDHFLGSGKLEKECNYIALVKSFDYIENVHFKSKLSFCICISSLILCVFIITFSLATQLSLIFTLEFIAFVCTAYYTHQIMQDLEHVSK